MNNKAQILIVDDDRANINVLGAMLADNYDIIVAVNGEQALQLIDTITPIDLVLLDINMPGIDGFEVCQKIKSNPASENIPVIFITANTNDNAERIGLVMGAVDYITKPFNQPIVQLRVRNHLELKRQRDLLAYLAEHDSLTGIHNRSKFDDFLSQEWQLGLSSKNSLALILIDIDSFKKYNDFYGHTVGDECLIKVAQCIKKSLAHATHLAARYGGEEFVCVLPNTDLRRAVEIAETIRDSVCQLNIAHQRSQVAKFVTISLGVSVITPEIPGASLALIQEADKMLYEAKNRGQNIVISRQNQLQE